MSKLTPKRNSKKKSKARAGHQGALVQHRHSSFTELNCGPDLFCKMVDRIGDEIMIIDKKMRIIFVNKAAIRGLGYSGKTILNRSYAEFLDNKTTLRQWQKYYYQKVKNRKRPLSFVMNTKSKGGKVRAMEMTISFLPCGADGFILTVSRDITAQLAIQEKLRESEHRYRLFNDQAADGIFIIDLQGYTLYANRSAGKMFKMPITKLVGSHFESHLDKTSLPKAWSYFNRVRNGTPITLGELEIKDSEGKLVPVEFTASPIISNKKIAQVHVVFRDISEKLGMEKLLRETEKMETFQHFIAGTTHEIQQPLKGLLEYSQRLIERYQDREFEYIGYKEFKDIIKTMRVMNDQVKYCCDTTDRLDHLNRRKANLHDQHCDVNAMIHESVKMLKHSLEVYGIQLNLQLNSKLPKAAISELDMRQVIINILTNAIQSLPSGGGTVKVRTSLLNNQRKIRIDCIDDGVGIPEELLPRVFDPFFTTKHRGLEKSSGLGLYIVYSIINAHKGEIIITSDHRKGTVVRMTLPAHTPPRKKKS